MLISIKLILKLSFKCCPKIELIILKLHFLLSASLVFYLWAGYCIHDPYVSLLSDKYFIFVHSLVSFIISNIPVLDHALIIFLLIYSSINLESINQIEIYILVWYDPSTFLSVDLWIHWCHFVLQPPSYSLKILYDRMTKYW